MLYLFVLSSIEMSFHYNRTSYSSTDLLMLVQKQTFMNRNFNEIDLAGPRWRHWCWILQIGHDYGAYT